MITLIKNTQYRETQQILQKYRYNFHVFYKIKYFYLKMVNTCGKIKYKDGSQRKGENIYYGTFKL